MHFYEQPEAIAHLVTAAVAVFARVADLAGDSKFPTLASNNKQESKLPA